LFNASHTANAVTALYDEQSGLSFTGTFTSIVYNVSAVAQSALSGTGPAYLINGYSNKGYWYQIGLSYDWVTNASNSHYIGFRANYEVFAPNGTSIYPSGGGGGSVELHGNVNPGDTVTLGLYMNNSTGMVKMKVYDKTTGAYYDTEYPSYGATEFIGNSSSPFINHGFFTGLMTEWYNVDPTFGNQLQVLYQEYGAVQESAYLWFDEYYCLDGWMCNSKQTIFSNSTSVPIYSSNPYIFSADGFAEEYYDNGEDFETGVSAPSTTVTTTVLYSTTTPITTISTSYPYQEIYVGQNITYGPFAINLNDLYPAGNTYEAYITAYYNGTYLNKSAAYLDSGENLSFALGNGIYKLYVGQTGYCYANLQCATMYVVFTPYQASTTFTTSTSTSIPSTTTLYTRQNATTTASPSNQTQKSESGSVFSRFIGSIVSFFENLFRSSSSSSTTTISSPSNCQSVINIGTDGSGSTGGNCSGFTVNIGTSGTYETACPSIVNIGTEGTYYNNVTGCSPQVNVGTGAKYYNINS